MWRLKDWWRCWSEKRVNDVIWLLPRWLIYRAAIRMWAHGTTGEYGNTDPTTLTLAEAIDRWQKQ